MEIGLLLLINYSRWAHELLGTKGLDAGTWLFLTPFGGLMLVLEELRKWIVRRRETGARHRGAATHQRDAPAIPDRDQTRSDAEHHN